jgi:hypothetical protein
LGLKALLSLLVIGLSPKFGTKGFVVIVGDWFNPLRSELVIAYYMVKYKVMLKQGPGLNW